MTLENPSIYPAPVVTIFNTGHGWTLQRAAVIGESSQPPNHSASDLSREGNNLEAAQSPEARAAGSIGSEAESSARQPVNPSTSEKNDTAITMETRNPPHPSKSDLGTDSGVSIMSGIVITAVIVGLGAWLLFKKKKKTPAKSVPIESAYSSKDLTLLHLARQLTEIFKKI